MRQSSPSHDNCTLLELINEGILRFGREKNIEFSGVRKHKRDDRSIQHVVGIYNEERRLQIDLQLEVGDGVSVTAYERLLVSTAGHNKKILYGFLHPTKDASVVYNQDSELGKALYLMVLNLRMGRVRENFTPNQTMELTKRTASLSWHGMELTFEDVDEVDCYGQEDVWCAGCTHFNELKVDTAATQCFGQIVNESQHDNGKDRLLERWTALWKQQQGDKK